MPGLGAGSRGGGEADLRPAAGGGKKAKGPDREARRQGGGQQQGPGKLPRRRWGG